MTTGSMTAMDLDKREQDKPDEGKANRFSHFVSLGNGDRRHNDPKKKNV